MKLMAWNYRGLARAPTFRTLRALNRRHSPDLIFLSETKVPPDRIQLALNGLGFPFLVQVPPVGLKGGLIIAWKQGVEVEPIRLDPSNLTCLIYSDPPFCPWMISCIHAPHTAQWRNPFWDSLSRVGNSFGGPWLLLGDFNSILSQSEKSGGRSFGSSSHNDFADFVHSNALIDLGFNGNRFTWSNHRQGCGNIRERLDRGLASQSWVHLFPNALINHLPAAQSDHCPILLSTSGSYQNLPKPFKFEAFWTRDLTSHSVVANAWLSDVSGSPAFSLSRRWKNTKMALKDWNHQHFGRIQSNIKGLLSKIDKIQSSPHSPDNYARELFLQDALQEQLQREDVLWKQKSREQWLTCKDLNTKFFHASTINRRRYNSINFLKAADGTICNRREDIGNMLVDHFSYIFSSTDPCLNSELDGLVHGVISDADNELLCTTPDEAEIFQAISQLGLNKSPGPDGMTGLFYKTYWPIVKENVIASVQSFFKGGFLLKEFNHTHIALIPKIDNPSRVNHFRPISLTNFNYKIISKILANRFKPLFHKFISPTQSAFLKGRSIHDNTILAHEIFHSMKQKKGNGGLLALKLDMEKAFDSMEWAFILKILNLLGFCPKWVNWIHQCISTSSFSILLDGSPFGKFSPSRGLRQGDPLSPFLFILGAEILSRLLFREEQAGRINGIKISRSSPPISHLLFADDLMIFSKAKSSEANSILSCLSTFSKWSGQKINLAKSSMFFSKNSKPSIISAIKGILNLTIIPSKARYLGIPLFIHKNKKVAFNDLKEKILSRITGWKAKLLSQAARTTLIKSVANAIPSYIMSLFLLPKSFCQSLNSSIRKFWWGFPQNKSHNLSFLAWRNICQPKYAGGLGIRSLEFLNKALLARLGWKIVTNQPLLWVEALKGKYLNNGHSFLDLPPNLSSSWLWKGILKNRKVIEKGACWAISNGVDINIWNSPWIPAIPNFKPSPNPNLVDLPDFKVADLIIQRDRTWNSLLLNDLFDPNTVLQIQNIHLSQVPSPDRWIWVPSPKGVFSVSSAHEVVALDSSSRPSLFSPEDWNCLWGLKLQHRLKHLLWKITWDMLPVRAKIGRIIPSQDPDAWICPFCNGPEETLQHIFLGCSFARILWRNIQWPIDTSSFSTLPISHWIMAVVKPHQFLSIPKEDVWRFQICAAVVLDHIWFSRNQIIHKAQHPEIKTSIKQIFTSFRTHLSAWHSSVSNSVWSPPPAGIFKANFDVAIRNDFSVAAAVLSDSYGCILAAASKRLSSVDVTLGESHAALLASQLVASHGCSNLLLEGDALTVITAINNPLVFRDWNFSSVVKDISLIFSSFQSCKALKVSRCANFRAHWFAKWAASNLVYGSIPIGFPILSSIRIKSGNDPPL